MFIPTFHGSLESNQEYLLEDITSGYPIIKNESELDHKLSHVDQKIILCGHSHLPQLKYLNHKVVVNPGSVGLQAYYDDFPVKHIMETSDPRASYAIIEFDGDSINIDHRKVEYDYQKASKMAEQNGRPDWVYSLLTGKAIKNSNITDS